jgi:integrase
VTRALTDTQIRSLRHPPAGQIDVKDVASPGLFLRITTETKVWSFRFTDPIGGKRQRMTLARFPDLGLADARERARELRTLVAKGVNPIEAKRQQRTEAPKRTFQFLADRYLAEYADRFKKPASAEADRRNLRLHVLPVWGDRQFAGISRGDIIELIEALIADRKPVLANRVHSLISKIFGFAVDSALLETNPASRLKKRAKETALTRVLTDPEIRLFWAAIDNPPTSKPISIALKLALLTGLRAGEVAGISKAEILDIDDPDRAAVLIAGTRVKNGRDHLVPLSPMARALVLEAREMAGNAVHLFPSHTNRTLALDPHDLARAMARFAADMPDSDDTRSWKAHAPTPHDLRRTIATRLSALGVVKEDRLAVLNHVEPRDIHKRHYDKHERQAEKRRALNIWAAALAKILDGGDDAGVVVPMRRVQP